MDSWITSAHPPSRAIVQPSTGSAGPHETSLHEADRLLAESRRLVAAARQIVQRNELLQRRTFRDSPSEGN